MKLYTSVGNFKGNSIQIVANYAQLKLEVVNTDLKTLKDKEFAKKSPFGLSLPILETADGLLSGSNAILRYLAKSSPASGLYGSSNLETTNIDMWLDTLLLELEPATLGVLLPIQGWVPYCAEREKRVIEALNKILGVYEKHLEGRAFLSGNSLTVADIATASLLANLFRFYLCQNERSKLPNLSKYFLSVSSNAVFQQTVGKVHLCIQPLKGHVAAAPAGKGKPAVANEKKDAGTKKEVVPKKKKDEEEEDDDVQEKPKGKNPLDLLPPTTFNLYDFKTLFVNAENKEEALKFFADNYDSNGYSLWYIKYDKAEGEGEKLYMTKNLMDGFLQRLETFRKYSFGVHGVYGDEPDLQIRGVWVWRGTEMPAEMKEHPSYEYHQYTRLDIKNEAHFSLVRDYWTRFEEEHVVDGLKVRHAVYFK